jgi:hypothetical protein
LNLTSHVDAISSTRHCLYFQTTTWTSLLRFSKFRGRARLKKFVKWQQILP